MNIAIEKLQCPKCLSSDFTTKEDTLTCNNCNAEYDIVFGIPRFSHITIAGNTKEEVHRFWNSAPNESLTVEQNQYDDNFFKETERKRYEDIHVNLGVPFFKDAIKFDSYKGKKILEVGCGIGMDSIQFARAGNDLTLLDLTINSLKITKKRLESENLNAEYVEADSENIPFKNETFDMVYSFGVIHHSPNTQRSLNEIHRVLKPGGEAVIMLYHKRSAFVWLHIFLAQGIRNGGLFKYGSLQKIMNYKCELQSATDSNEPVLTQAFTKRQIKQMFSEFKIESIETHYLSKFMLPYVYGLVKLLPKRIQQNLHKSIGWNLIIKAKKK